MATLRQLTTRIKSVQSTSKLTKAMQAVASMRLRYAQQALGVANHYITHLHELAYSVNADLKGLSSPWIKNSQLISNETGTKKSKILVVIIAPTRGFCGGLHRFVSQKAYAMVRERGLDPFDRNQVVFITVNKPAMRMSSRLGGYVFASFNNISKNNDVFDVLPISTLVGNLWLNPEQHFDGVYIVSAKPSPSSRYRIALQPLLPLESAFSEFASESISTDRTINSKIDIDAEKLLKELAPQWVEAGIHEALVASKVVEEKERIVAMNQASDNAKKLVDKLKLDYSKQRQAKITQEVSELFSA